MSDIDRRHLLATALSTPAFLPGLAEARAIIGKPAPKFSLTTFDRRQITSEELIGKVVVLNYWAVWCGPCKRELPEIDSYVRRKGGDDLKIFAVTVDDTATDSQLRPLASLLSFPLVTRINGTGYGRIDGAVPSNYVIDRSGVLRYARAEAFDYSSFDHLITPLLAENRRSSPSAST
jgi:cytochrome c biogenesis protein CcmG/thiol:disulfide interchange protein DsbE